MCSGGGSSTPNKPNPLQARAEGEYNQLVGGAFKPGLEHFNEAVRRNAEGLGYQVTIPDQNDPNSFTATKQHNVGLSSLFSINPKNTSLTQTTGRGIRMDPVFGAVPVPSQTYQVIR